MGSHNRKVSFAKKETEVNNNTQTHLACVVFNSSNVSFFPYLFLCRRRKKANDEKNEFLGNVAKVKIVMFVYCRSCYLSMIVS